MRKGAKTMQKADYPRFRELLLWAAQVTVVPNGKDAGEISLALFDALAGYPLDAVRDAVEAHCRAEKFFPMLADIVARIEGTAADRAQAAWALVMRAVERIGSWDSVRFPDAAIHYAISQMGGWMHLCEILTDTREPFLAQDFSRHFLMGERLSSWEERPGGVKVQAYFPGRHEVDNRSKGLDRRRIFDAATGKEIKHSDIPAIEPPRSAPVVHLVSGLTEAKIASPS